MISNDMTHGGKERVPTASKFRHSPCVLHAAPRKSAIGTHRADRPAIICTKGDTSMRRGIIASLTLFAATAAPAATAQQATQDWQTVDMLTQAVAGAMGRTAVPIDRRIVLASCPEQPAISALDAQALAVRCPSLGWRLRVPLLGAPDNGAADPPRRRTRDTARRQCPRQHRHGQLLDRLCRRRDAGRRRRRHHRPARGRREESAQRDRRRSRPGADHRLIPAPAHRFPDPPQPGGCRFSDTAGPFFHLFSASP